MFYQSLYYPLCSFIIRCTSFIIRCTVCTFPIIRYIDVPWYSWASLTLLLLHFDEYHTQWHSFTYKRISYTLIFLYKFAFFNHHEYHIHSYPFIYMNIIYSYSLIQMKISYNDIQLFLWISHSFTKMNITKIDIHVLKSDEYYMLQKV